MKKPCIKIATRNKNVVKEVKFRKTIEWRKRCKRERNEERERERGEKKLNDMKIGTKGKRMEINKKFRDGKKREG